jgi:hypothetical protein
MLVRGPQTNLGLVLAQFVGRREAGFIRDIDVEENLKGWQWIGVCVMLDSLHIGEFPTDCPDDVRQISSHRLRILHQVTV